MLKILVFVMLLISYLDTIQIAVPIEGQKEGVLHDNIWAIFHTLAYGLAASIILFEIY